MITYIDLPSDRFIDDTISGFKQKNFIYGKNGTGKTSLTKEIEKQYSDSYDVHVFSGFNSVVGENGKLNTISLGVENVELQPKINDIENKIDRIRLDMIEPIAGDSNTYKRKEIAITLYKKKEKEINDFLTEAARIIKNTHNEWSGVNYNIRKIRLDIEVASRLSKEDEEKYQSHFNQKQLVHPNKINFEEFDINDLIDKVNSIMTTDIVESTLIHFDNDEKRSWVGKGIKLHQEGDNCAFCGSKISNKRLQDLNSYFDEHIRSYEHLITTTIEDIDNKIKKIHGIEMLQENQFYYDFQSELDVLNRKITSLKLEYNTFLENINKELRSRKESLFISKKPLKTQFEMGYREIEDEYDKFYSKNIDYSNKLEELKKEAKKKLLLNEVSKQVEKFGYIEHKAKCDELLRNKSEAEEEFKQQQSLLDQLKTELETLQSQTIDENIAANKINKQLELLGNQSFKLKKADVPDQEVDRCQ